MESKKTAELRKYKGFVKSKMLAAIAMLLVSSLVLTSTTYAWFVLSTAPEVTGMSTTIGSNGSLEIALLNNETGSGETPITATVGDSVAKQDVTKSNETWGNVVSLAGSYGLENVTLYPAALNVAEDNTTFVSRTALLAVPVYGTDGRVAELSADEVVAGKKGADGAFVSSADDYGVRAVGTSGDVDPVALALANAQNAYGIALKGAQTAATKALNGDNNDGANASALMKLIMKSKLKEYEDKLASNETFAGIDVVIEPSDEAALGTIVTYLGQAAGYIEDALKAYAAGYEASQGNVVSASNIDLANYTSILNTPYLTALTSLKSDIEAAQATYEGVQPNGEGVKDYSPVLNAMIDLNKTDVEDADGNRKALSAYTDADITGLMSMPKIYVMGGLLSDVADFTDVYESKPFSFKTTMQAFGVTNGTMIATPSSDVTTAHLVVLGTALSKMETSSGEGAAVVAIASTYGYVIDLAFRASVNTNLTLSAATQRVESSNEDSTMGAGSNFVVTTGTDGLDALRVVFINADNEIIGVAKLADAAENGAYALHMHEYTITTGANGTTLTVGAQKANDEIMALTAAETTQLSVLVYIDGDAVDSAMDTTNGKLNLQFASTEPLTAMDYAGYEAPAVPGAQG